MKTKLLALTIISLFFYSCSESNSSRPIDFKDVIGCYHYTIRIENEYICIFSDFTYLHKITDGKGSIIFSETGKVVYNRRVRTNVLILLDFSRIREDGSISKRDTYFFVRKRWGRITIAHSFNADPDGAPRIPRYRRIRAEQIR